jgi:hypothetical protein
MTKDERLKLGITLLGKLVRRARSGSQFPLAIEGGQAIVHSVLANGTVQLVCPCCGNLSGQYDPETLEPVPQAPRLESRS